MRIALIGNRDLENGEHNDDVVKYYQVCYQLAKMGVTMTSGLAAKGCDAIAQRAYGKAIALKEGKANIDSLEVYVAQQKNINKSDLPYKEYSIIMPSDQEATNKRREILKSVLDYNHYQALTMLKNNYALGMHERNVHQILGKDLQSPIDLVLTWCKPGHSGTRTSLEIARLYNIPIINLYNNPGAIAELELFLKNYFNKDITLSKFVEESLKTSVLQPPKNNLQL